MTTILQCDGSAMLSWYEPAAEQESPSERIVEAERALQLARALEQLPDDQGEAVRLRHLEGRKLVEIAESMNKTPDAVAGLARRGVATIRKCLADSEANG